MKKIFLCCIAALILLAPQTGKSQDSTTIQGLLQYIMQPLDKNQIGNGYLEEYGFPAISMATYNGVLSANNRFELNSWRLMYFQLFTCWCRSTANPMTPISTVNNTIKTNTSPTLPTPIPILIGQYNNVKANAFSSNMLSYNASQRKVYDVPGRTQNPYESKVLFAAVPVNQYSTDGSESFIYRSNMVWGNTNLTVSQLQVNFGNGAGLQTLTANTPINVNYTDTGAYVWTIRATLSDNSVVQCYSDYFVLAVPSGAQRFLPINITTPGWGNIAPVAGVHGGATVNVIYSTKQPTVPVTLRKPLIIIENMDAFNIAPSLQPNPYRIEDFINAINATNQSFYDFNQQLDDIAGYDLVFINFNDGVDGIVRNAAVVQAAITAVNNAKQPDNRSGRREQNVVMGIGTGGLHARYALANMTKNFASTPTETRLLITHDAPHRGANIALGLQHLSRMLGNFSYFGTTSADIFPDYAETVAFFNAPINVETLLYRATSDVANSPNTFMSTTYRSMVDFAPGAQPYQFVPTSLGNECARPLFTAGRLFMDFKQGVATGVKAKLSIFGFTIPVNIPVADLKYDCVVYASSIPAQNASGRKIAEVKTVFKFVLLGFIQIFKVGYDKAAEAPTTYLAVDGVPGSINTILDLSELRNYSNSVGNWSYTPEDQLLFYLSYKEAVKLKFYAFTKAFQYNSGVFTTQYTALPVGSALDVDPFNSSTFTQKYVNGVNTNFPSKGNTFIAQETNTTQSLFNNASMRFTARNARFMFKEMEQLPNLENCSGECSNPFVIAGPDPICTTGTFTLPGLQRGASVTWNVTPTGLVTPGIQGNPITLTRNPNASGVLTLTANLGAGCSNATTLTKTIQVGSPNATIQILGIAPLPNTQMDVSVTTLAPPPYNWYVDGSLVKTQTESSQSPVTINGGGAGNHILRCDVTNSCGTASISQSYNRPPSGFRIVVSPNPVSSNLAIIFSEQTDLEAVGKQQGQELKPAQPMKSTGRTIATLFEFNTRKQVRQWTQNETSSKGYNYNVAGLRKGLYILQVDRNNQTATTKIIIE